MNKRPKISSLTEQELAQLLLTCFFKIGREVNLSKEKLKIFMGEIYTYQGWMYVDTFSDAFSRFAACELPDAESVRPSVSPFFVGRLMKLYFKKCKEKNFIAKSVKDSISILTPQEKLALFVKYISVNKCMPANPDWVGIYSCLAELNKITISTEWENLSFAKRWKLAMEAVCEWAYKNFTITNQLVYREKCYE